MEYSIGCMIDDIDEPVSLNQNITKWKQPVIQMYIQIISPLHVSVNYYI